MKADRNEKVRGGKEVKNGRLWKRACCTVKIGIFGACFYYDAVQL